MKQRWLAFPFVGALVVGIIAACDGTTVMVGQGAQPLGPEAGGPGTLGAACVSHDQCARGICVVVGQGRSVCSRDCSQTTDCVAGWSCGPLGERPGAVCLCTAHGAGGGPDGEGEGCNGRDDDCNGIVDDPEPSAMECDARLPQGISAPGRTVCLNGACACTPSFTACTSPGGIDLCIDLKTDWMNCGACGNICQNGTQCVAGECRCGTSSVACAPDPVVGTPLCRGDQCETKWGLSRTAYPVGLAFAGDDVLYSVDTTPIQVEQKGLYRVRKSGGPPSFLGSHVGRIATEGTAIVVAGETVTSCVAPDCAKPITLGNGHRNSWGVAVLNGLAYFNTSSSAVATCPVSGCTTPTTILPPRGEFYPIYLAADASDVYIFQQDVGEGLPWNAYVSHGGAAATPIANGAGRITGVTTDASHVYWATDGGLYRCAKSGCAATISTFVSGSSVSSPTVDDSHVYWLDLDKFSGAAAMKRCPRAGCTGAPTTVTPAGLTMAQDTSHLYFFVASSANGPALGRIPKPL